MAGLCPSQGSLQRAKAALEPGIVSRTSRGAVHRSCPGHHDLDVDARAVAVDSGLISIIAIITIIIIVIVDVISIVAVEEGVAGDVKALGGHECHLGRSRKHGAGHGDRFSFDKVLEL